MTYTLIKLYLYLVLVYNQVTLVLSRVEDRLSIVCLVHVTTDLSNVIHRVGYAGTVVQVPVVGIVRRVWRTWKNHPVTGA